jgi:sigma-B regulation protein RsbU (phosphoserine phosphatase)
MKTTKGRQPGRSSKPGPLCEQRHDIFTASTADYIYGVTMHQGRWVATFHGAGCEAITGYTPAEMDVDPLLWFRMIHEEDRAPVLRHLSQLSNGEDLPPIEHRIVSKVGKVRWI